LATGSKRRPHINNGGLKAKAQRVKLAVSLVSAASAQILNNQPAVRTGKIFA